MLNRHPISPLARPKRSGNNFDDDLDVNGDRIDLPAVQLFRGTRGRGETARFDWLIVERFVATNKLLNATSQNLHLCQATKATKSPISNARKNFVD